MIVQAPDSCSQQICCSILRKNIEIETVKMDQDNLLCGAHNCANPAVVFGLKENKKIRGCKEHLDTLLAKTTQLFNISGYFFISSSEDAELLNQRKAQQEKGCGNLTVLEASCDAELTAVLQAIESAKKKVITSIEDRFEEMKVAVTMACAEAKQQLSLLQQEFLQFITWRESQLSPAAELVCSGLSAKLRLLRFGLAEVAESVSAVLSSSWTVCKVDVPTALLSLDASQKQVAVEAALAEATDQARKGIPDALLFAELTIGKEETFEEEKKAVLFELLKFESVRCEQNFKWVQRSWDLGQRSEISDDKKVEIGHQLAKCLYRQGSFSEAEETLRICYNIAQSCGTASEELMSLSNDLCGVYFARAQYQVMQQLCEWVLETFATAGLSAEHCWTTLLYLTYSMKWLNQHREANELLEKWEKRGLQEESDYAKMLRALTHGIKAFFETNYKEAGKCLQQARSIGVSQFPTSFFTALALYHLARVNEREQYHQQAKIIYEVVAPKSAHAGNNLKCLGELLMKQGKWSEAEDYMNQAQFIFESAAPRSVPAGYNLIGIGQLFEAKQEKAQAFQYFREAANILMENGDEVGKTEAEEAMARLKF